MSSWRDFAVAAALGVMSVAALPGSAAARPAIWSQPQAPFRIVGDIYYVGSKGLAAYLLVSPQGDILLDGTLPENAPMIERNIAALGFRIRDIRILLNSHAHYDHAGGLTRLKADSGAVMMASDGDRWALEHGASRGDNTASIPGYPKVQVDQTVADGQTVRLGPLAMTALLTPGHTPGCTTWITEVAEQGRRLNVVFPSCFTVAGNVLIGNQAYPRIAADYRSSFNRLGALKADVVLPAHPEFADLLRRQARAKAGDTAAFIDAGQLPRLVAASKADFEKALAAQAAKTPGNASLGPQP